MPSILFYCEQLYGTGHFSRTLNLIEALLEKNKDITVYFIFGGKIPEGRSVPTCVKFLHLEDDFPTSKAEALSVDIKLLISNRFGLIYNFLSGIDSLDDLYVEFYPFGRCHLVKFFRYIINTCKSWFPTLVVTSFIREVMDIQEKNRDKNIAEAILYVDQILVCGEREKNEVFLGAKELSILDPIVKYVGYVVPKSTAEAYTNLSTLKKKKSLIVSAGGGEDGNDILKEVIDALLNESIVSEFDQINIFLPSNSNNEYLFSKVNYSNLKNIKIHRYSRDYLHCLKESEMHICMGGYNTVFESIAYNVGLVVIPRLWETEQQVRLSYLSEHYRCEVISERPISSGCLKSSIQKLRENISISDFDLTGATKIAEIIFNKETPSSLGRINLLKIIFNNYLSMDHFPGLSKVSHYMSLAIILSKKINWNGHDINAFLDSAKNREVYYLMRSILPFPDYSPNDYSLDDFRNCKKWYRALSILEKDNASDFKPAMNVMDTLIYFEAMSVLSGSNARSKSI
jgi:predicted glycosyltransferase